MTGLFAFLVVNTSTRLPLEPSPPPSVGDLVEEGAHEAMSFAQWFATWPLRVILILVGGVIVLLLVRHAITRVTNGIAHGEVKGRRAQRAKTVGSVLRSAANIIIVSLMALMILNAVGAGYVVMPVLASAGVLGVAIGFGAQSLVRDFLSGIFILIEDQYGVGDEVDLGQGASGLVEKMDLRLTHVRAFDGTLWHVRNGEVLRAGNHTQQWARSVAKVEVPVGSDVEAVRAALHKAVERVVNSEEHSPNLLEDPTVRGIDALGEGTYTFTMHARVLPGTDYPINRALLECAREELITAGVLGAAPLG